MGERIKLLWFLIVIIIAWTVGAISYDWYNTYKLTQEGSEVPETSEIKFIWDIAPVQKIESTKKLDINVDDYKLLLSSYDAIKSISGYKYNVNKNLHQNIIIKPTIYELFKK